MKNTINCNGKLISLDKPIVMGILNITPDSFFDGGKYLSDVEIINRAEQMICEGASIIDIGAISTRPNSIEISENEEMDRLLPKIKILVKKFPDTVFSVDTWRAKIAEIAVKEGVAMINDISAGSFDTDMFQTIANLKVPYIMMHTNHKPQVMQNNPSYKNVVEEIIKYFAKKINELKLMGVNDIIIDPGFGFGKTIEHNYEILKNLNIFQIIDKPILVGISRKSMIYKLLENTPQEAANGSSVANTIALLKGAKIIRTHDIKETADAIKIVSKTLI